MNRVSCLNCETHLQQDHRFCPQCGQRAGIHRLNCHEITHDVVHYFTHADKSIFQLVGRLAVTPGVVAAEYLAGRRQRYFKPLNFFLIVAGIVAFMTSLFYTPNNSRSRQIQYAAQQIKDPVRKLQMQQMAKRSETVNAATGKYSNIINMIATPLLTLFFWLAYRRQYNFAEALVANMYFTGFIMLVYALLVVPLQRVLPQFSLVVIALFFLFEIIYRGRSFYQFATKRGAWAAAKAYGVSAIITLCWMLGTYSLIAYYIRYGF